MGWVFPVEFCVSPALCPLARCSVRALRREWEDGGDRGEGGPAALVGICTEVKREDALNTRESQHKSPPQGSQQLWAVHCLPCCGWHCSPRQLPQLSRENDGAETLREMQACSPAPLGICDHGCVCTEYLGALLSPC